LRDDLARSEVLYAQIEAARKTQQRDALCAKVRYLLPLVESATAAAASALAQLHKLACNIQDWAIIVPDGLPAAAQETAARMLALAASTTSLSEARVAVAKFRHLCHEHGIDW